MDVSHEFRGKKITLLGLGLLGRGVGDAAFLAGCGAELIVTDKKSAEELAPSVDALKQYPNITFHLGSESAADFQGRDLIVKAAGVPKNAPLIAVAHAAGTPVVMSTALAARYAREGGAKLIGVTGTRGKSTVTHMIYHTLTAAHRYTHLGGNIRGLSTLAMLPEINHGDLLVLELDSWQLQGFGDLQLSPEIAVFTNLMPDHMNYYGGDMEAYFADKANIFRFQKPSDRLVVGEQVALLVHPTHPPAEPIIPTSLSTDWQLKIPGEHNRENAALVRAALEPLLSEEEIKTGIESFEGVEGRLQLVREVHGVKIYNDNNATTPEATIAALRALGAEKRIVLIAGGSDKHLDLTALVAEINRTCKAVLLLDGAGTKRLIESGCEAPVYADLASAFTVAMEIAIAGDTVLFSPGFASFGIFQNEYERNDQFLALVRAR